ncbi:hypothetical protein IE53DRAFT_92893 [Violaceomyces palustris]|uniref:Uncharacterized protein n=1 Tax=Violaceomyces palustris TaxID=1673888 RepID=A0ACD0NXQ1_9BASI|nr:hypothetical protein IE53DRAFT_92893 [Violaceomyces palustris]
MIEVIVTCFNIFVFCRCCLGFGDPSFSSSSLAVAWTVSGRLQCQDSLEMPTVLGGAGQLRGYCQVEGWRWRMEPESTLAWIGRTQTLYHLQLGSLQFLTLMRTPSEVLRNSHMVGDPSGWCSRRCCPLDGPRFKRKEGLDGNPALKSGTSKSRLEPWLGWVRDGRGVLKL